MVENFCFSSFIVDLCPVLLVDCRDRGVLVLGVLDVKSVPNVEIVDLMSAFVSRHRRDSPRPGNTHPRHH